MSKEYLDALKKYATVSIKNSFQDLEGNLIFYDNDQWVSIQLNKYYNSPDELTKLKLAQSQMQTDLQFVRNQLVLTDSIDSTLKKYNDKCTAVSDTSKILKVLSNSVKEKIITLKQEINDLQTAQKQISLKDYNDQEYYKNSVSYMDLSRNIANLEQEIINLQLSPYLIDRAAERSDDEQIQDLTETEVNQRREIIHQLLSRMTKERQINQQKLIPVVKLELDSTQQTKHDLFTQFKDDTDFPYISKFLTKDQVLEKFALLQAHTATKMQSQTPYTLRNIKNVGKEKMKFQKQFLYLNNFQRIIIKSILLVATIMILFE